MVALRAMVALRGSWRGSSFLLRGAVPHRGRAVCAVNDGVEVPETGVETVFYRLADSVLLVDPSGGTCCRNACSGCAYLRADGSYALEEVEVPEGAIAPYVRVEVPPREATTAAWCATLFPGDAAKASRPAYDAALGTSDAANQLWTLLSQGAPELSRVGVAAKLKTLSQAPDAPMTLGDFRTALATTLEADAPPPTVDYESMDVAELRTLCVERGIKAPPVPRLVIEELRFFDVHGRPGVRNRATRQLE